MLRTTRLVPGLLFRSKGIRALSERYFRAQQVSGYYPIWVVGRWCVSVFVILTFAELRNVLFSRPSRITAAE